MATGQITRKDIITDEALKWGSEYAKLMDEAISKNKAFVDGIILLNAENVKLRRSENQTEFIKQKNEVKLISEKTTLALKEQTVAEIGLEKVKQESLKTDKLALDVEAKKETAKKRNIKLTAEERVQNEFNNRAEKQALLAKLNLTEAYTKLSNERTKSKNILRDLVASENASTEAIKKARAEFEKLDAKVKMADRAVGDFTKNVGNYPKLTSFTIGVKNLISAFGLIGGVALFASVIKGAINIVKEFEQGIADLSAITGATGKDLEYLKKQSIELGKATKGGAVAVVEAYKLIASAKPELLENVEALNQVTEAVLTLAKASGMEMPAAATALTDAMNQFGADASQATKFVDTLAAGAKYGAAEIPQITEALLKFGAVSRTANISIQESTALVELLAENGLKGADAGTALRNVLLKLSAPDALPLKAKEAIERLGISFKDLSDTSKPIQERLELIKPLLKDTAGMVKVFGLENVVAATNVLQHTDRLADLTEKVNENGTALEQANIRTDTLSGAFDRLESKWSAFILSLGQKGNGLGTLLKGVTNTLSDTIEGWTYLFESGEESRQRILSGLRKKGYDELLAYFNSEKDLKDSDIANDVNYNIEKTKEALKTAETLKNRNLILKALIRDTPLGKIESNANKAERLANEKSIKELNNLIANLGGQIAAGKEALKVKNSSTKTGENPSATDAIIAETEKQKKAREKAAKDKLEAEKRYNDSLYELEKQRLERSISINNEIAKDENETDEVRLLALEQSQDRQTALLLLNRDHLLDNDKLLASERTRINEDYENKVIDLNKKTQEEIDKINEFDVKVYEDNLKRGITAIETANNAELEAEEKRFQALEQLGFDSDKAREDAVRDHEENLFNIKKEFAIATAKLLVSNLKTELDAYELQSDGSKKSQDFILEKRKAVSEATLKLTQLEGDNFVANEDKKELTAKEKTTLILEFAQEALGHLSDLANAFSQRKIQNIDEEIEKNNENYDKQIEDAEGNELKQKLLEADRQKRNEALEIKKRKEQEKQAKFDKEVTIAQIAIQTALSIMKAAPNPVAVAFASILGAIQLAAAIATPIPKYKMGRKGGKAEWAEVGDGFVHEVITGPDGSNPRLTPNKPTITHLGQGDIVHKSIEDYQKYLKASIMNNFELDNRRISEFQLKQNNDLYGKESLAVMKETLSVLKKQKNGTIINMPKIDIPYAIWKSKNTNWN